MADVEICRWVGLPHRADLVPEIEAIFFGASATTSFISDSAKAAFVDRWLGRYLIHYPEDVFLALDGGGRVQGYLAGCLNDPSGNALFADIAYFQTFQALLAPYPAHLHVNVAEGARERGIGAKLVAAFAERASAAGVPGMHVVTEQGMRNVGFYLANGFRVAGATVVGDRTLVLLGRDLSAKA
jgi:GNAT superfamily N-acetyltransferase